jgi:hypothetical protein
MLCDKGTELNKRREETHLAYMDALNPGAPWKEAISRDRIVAITLDKKMRYELAEKALSHHKRECKICTS